MTTHFYKKSKKQTTQQQLEAWKEHNRENEALRTLAEHEGCYDSNTKSNASETDNKQTSYKNEKTNVNSQNYQ